ncbi:hypothetical protein WR25_15863 [Diploscapter pachys]|uniref:Uncharacterized protein n=1 Tax=Diploscapter pachys TaxID=2018661 RepID=A0A2A2LM59_9BILA|nr:hypothetical protein WR25_15863 [Diploscapter pachys]
MGNGQIKHDRDETRKGDDEMIDMMKEEFREGQWRETNNEQNDGVKRQKEGEKARRKSRRLAANENEMENNQPGSEQSKEQSQLIAA